jgi:hypothetical protein
MFWICERCKTYEAIKMIKTFLDRGTVYSKDEIPNAEENLKRLEGKLKELNNSGLYPKQWLPRHYSKKKLLEQDK